MKKIIGITICLTLFLGINAMLSFASEEPSGSEVYRANCGKCHAERSPREFNDDEWRAVMTIMRVRAGLTAKETKAVLEFLQSEN